MTVSGNDAYEEIVSLIEKEGASGVEIRAVFAAIRFERCGNRFQFSPGALSLLDVQCAHKHVNVFPAPVSGANLSHPPFILVTFDETEGSFDLCHDRGGIPDRRNFFDAHRVRW